MSFMLLSIILKIFSDNRDFKGFREVQYNVRTLLWELMKAQHFILKCQKHILSQNTFPCAQMTKHESKVFTITYYIRKWFRLIEFEFKFTWGGTRGVTITKLQAIAGCLASLIAVIWPKSRQNDVKLMLKTQNWFYMLTMQLMFGTLTFKLQKQAYFFFDLGTRYLDGGYSPDFCPIYARRPPDSFDSVSL